MTSAEFKLKETLHKIAQLEKKLAKRNKGSRGSSPILSPIIKTCEERKFIFPKLQTNIRRLDFELPEEYFTNVIDERSPSLISSRKKKRSSSSTSSSMLSPNYSLNSKRKKIDVERTHIAVKERFVALTRENKTLTTLPRVEEGSPQSFVFSSNDDTHSVYVPHSKYNGRKCDVFLTWYLVQKCSKIWTSFSTLLLTEPRKVENVKLVKTKENSSLYLSYYLPDILITRIHKFIPDTENDGCYIHIPFVSRKARLEKFGLVRENDFEALWGNSSLNLCFWDLNTGEIMRIIPKNDPAMDKILHRISYNTAG